MKDTYFIVLFLSPKKINNKKNYKINNNKIIFFSDEMVGSSEKICYFL